MIVDRTFHLRQIQFARANPYRVYVIKTGVYRGPNRIWLVYRGYTLLDDAPTQSIAMEKADRLARAFLHS